MPNHYHLLLQTHQENLSKCIRQINMQYAIYFNKKYQRSGHLWQGRFKSWYVTDEAYLYTLILYIEQNPLKAKLVDSVKEYPYSSARYFLDQNRIPACLQDAWIVKHYRNDTESIRALLHSLVDTEQLHELKKASSLIEAPTRDKKPDKATLKTLLDKARNIQHRNRLISRPMSQAIPSI